MSNFSDTVAGKILIGAVVGIIGTLFGAFVTWITIANEPPIADLVPSTLEAAALQPISFSAEASSDPEGGELTYIWSLNALPFGSSPAANCSPSTKASLINCRFVMPGTHAVSVLVSDDAGLSNPASASVTVTVERGYVSLYIKAPGGQIGQAAAETALLYGVDWSDVQSRIGRPVILFDPELGSSVYAATVERDIEKARAALDAQGATDNLKIGGSGLRPEVRDLITVQASDAGMSLFFFDLPAGEVISGTETGIGDGGFILTTSPAQFEELRKR